MKRMLGLALVLAGMSTAHAQSGYILPNGAGGYVVAEPGAAPSYINPNGAGGYIVTTPGQAPTSINPIYGGGYTVTTPGRCDGRC